MHGIIQIAGIIDQQKANMLVNSGVHQLGFPFGLSFHKEDITEKDAAKIIRSLKQSASAVLITYLNEAEKILDICRRIGTCKVQLHGDISLTELIRLKSLFPDLSVIKSLIVRDHNLAELGSFILSFSPYADAFIIDTYDPITGAFGATGKTHNWDISHRLVDISRRPVMQTGGLKPENVRRAIARVQPAGVDVHTGVERPDGRKNADLVRNLSKRQQQPLPICDVQTIDDTTLAISTERRNIKIYCCFPLCSTGLWLAAGMTLGIRHLGIRESEIMKKFTVRTNARAEMIDITGLIRTLLKESRIKSGICHVFIPHTTAAVTINENADPDVPQDILMELDKIVPLNDHYRHTEGNSAAHIKASIIGASEAVFIEDGDLVLGTWQSIFFCEFDGPRTRQVVIRLTPIESVK